MAIFQDVILVFPECACEVSGHLFYRVEKANFCCAEKVFCVCVCVSSCLLLSIPNTNIAFNITITLLHCS